MAARNTRAHPVSAPLAVQCACPEDWASWLSNEQMLAQAKLAAKAHIWLGWDSVSWICSIETHCTTARNTGVLPVSVCMLLLCNMHVWRAGHTSDVQMLAPAKPDIGWGWDLVSLIGSTETSGMTVRNTEAIPVSAHALLLCNAHALKASAAMSWC